jgi:hypothetical protein
VSYRWAAAGMPARSSFSMPSLPLLGVPKSSSFASRGKATFMAPVSGGANMIPTPGSYVHAGNSCASTVRASGFSLPSLTGFPGDMCNVHFAA